MEKPKLSFYIAIDGELVRYRTRSYMGLGAPVELHGIPFRVVGLGWEGDQFVVDVNYA